MTEGDLEALLVRGGRRLKLEHALRLGLATFALGVVLAAAAIFALRLVPLARPFTPAAELLVVQFAVAAPFVLAFVAAVVAYRRRRPALDHVALLLDTRANLAEHLVTWYQLRVPLRASPQCHVDDGMRREFLAAQCAATLAVAGGLDPRQAVPIRMPEWSRALWLALLLLCCALLMPPRVSAERRAGAASGDARMSAALRHGASGLGASPALPGQAPRVQVLNPTEMLVFQLKGTDPLLPRAAKAGLLRELLKKIGNVPESELAPEVRELLSTLRSEVADKPENGGKPGSKNGSQQSTGKGEPPQSGDGASGSGAAQVPDFREKAMTMVQQNFSDVKGQLERYYTGGNGD